MEKPNKTGDSVTGGKRETTSGECIFLLLDPQAQFHLGELAESLVRQKNLFCSFRIKDKARYTAISLQHYSQIPKGGKQSKCPLINKWIKNVVCTYN